MTRQPGITVVEPACLIGWFCGATIAMTVTTHHMTTSCHGNTRWEVQSDWTGDLSHVCTVYYVTMIKHWLETVDA